VSPSLSHASQTQVRPEPAWKTLLESAAVEVFEMMASVRLEPMPVPEGEPAGDRTAMVGMAGALCGMATIRCTSETAMKLAARMLDGEAAANPATVGDALGELCNMVAGNFKSKVSGLNDRCMLSVPTVISGEDYVLQAVSSNEGFSLALSLEGSPVWFSLIIHS
jgi:chemotaxis protein CheX